ncbi:MAG: ribosome silencing factor [Pirellulales bacterium]|nr:ribosome silencing factor [Pirellulales bacterium]
MLTATVPKTGYDPKANRGLERAVLAAQTAHDNRGKDILLLDLRQLTPVFDYFVVATGTSRRQMHAMAEEIDRELVEKFNDRRLGQEGYAVGNWILLDYGDIVVHLFDESARDYYALDQLWSGATKVDWQAAGPKIAS